MNLGLKAPLIEVFASIQGEGSYVGQPMTFVRVAVCPIRCLYCDTPNSYVAPAEFPLHLGKEQRLQQNPVTAVKAAALAQEASQQAGHGDKAVVSLTGGEPLLYPGFVLAFGEELQQRGMTLHLETAALDAEALQHCVASLAHLSADYKLPETLTDGDYGLQHVACVVAALAAGVSVDVKLVLTPAVSDSSFALALQRLQDHAHAIQLILQPVTPFGAVQEALSSASLLALMQQAQGLGFTPRVLPQMHKQLRLP